jgi:predicted metal-dependent phosphoesterase TrpH
VPPLHVARRCRQVGLSPIVLTDHDVIEGARSLADGGQPVIIGEEILTTQGELIGLFLKAAIPKGLSPEATVAVIKHQGGLVYLEHPYDISRRHLNEDAIERIANQIDIVEVFNGRSQPEFNRRAEELRNTLGAAAGAGSDAHTLREIGRVFVEMEAFDGAHDFLVKLRGGRIVIRASGWIAATKRRLTLHSR